MSAWHPRRSETGRNWHLHRCESRSHRDPGWRWSHAAALLFTRRSTQPRHRLHTENGGEYEEATFSPCERLPRLELLPQRRASRLAREASALTRVETATSAATMIVASGAGGRAVAGAAIAARLSSRKRTSLGAGSLSASNAATDHTCRSAEKGSGNWPLSSSGQALPVLVPRSGPAGIRQQESHGGASASQPRRPETSRHRHLHLCESGSYRDPDCVDGGWSHVPPSRLLFGVEPTDMSDQAPQ